MSFAERLRGLRKELGLSQDEMGARCGLHGRHIGRFEIGAAMPSAETLVAIARACGTSIDFLLRDEVEEAGLPAASDAELRRRLRQLAALPAADRRAVFAMIDAIDARRERSGGGARSDRESGGTEARRGRKGGAEGTRGTARRRKVRTE